MSKRFSWSPRTQVGDKHNQLTVVDNTIEYRNSIRYITVQCDCGNTYQTREFGFLNRAGSGLCRPCSMSAAGLQKRLPDNESAKNDYRNDYIQNAKTRGYDWLLSKEDFEKLIFSNCFYCGASPSKRKASRNSVVLVNGVDRYVNSKGYSKENCVTACWTCNSAKRSLDGDEFIEWAGRISDLHNKFGLKR